MNTLMISGAYMNILTRATATPSSANALYPISHIANGRPSFPFMFNAAAADDNIIFDLAEDTNGGMEDSPLVGYTDDSNGAGNLIAEDGAIKYAGFYSMKLTLATAGGGNYARGYVDLEVPTGQRRSIIATLYGDGTISARVRAQIVELDLWVQSDGTLSTEADIWSRSVANWQTQTVVTFIVPTMDEACGRKTVTLRLIAIAEEAVNTGVAHVDNLYTWPSWDAAAMHGIAPGPVTCQLRTSTDGFVGSDDLQSAMDIDSPVMYYHTDTPVDRRWMQIKFPGTNHEPLEIGEAIVGQTVVLTTTPQIQHDVTFIDDALTSETIYGEPITLLDSRRFQRRQVPLEFKHRSLAALEQQLEIFRRSQGAANWIWLVLDETKDGPLYQPILGKIEREWKPSRFVRRGDDSEVWTAKIIITELPYQI